MTMLCCQRNQIKWALVEWKRSVEAPCSNKKRENGFKCIINFVIILSIFRDEVFFQRKFFVLLIHWLKKKTTQKYSFEMWREFSDDISSFATIVIYEEGKTIQNKYNGTMVIRESKQLRY